MLLNLYEQAKKAGENFNADRWLEQQQAIDDLEEIMIRRQAFSNRVIDSSWLVDPLSGLPYGAKTLLQGNPVSTPAIGNAARILAYTVPVGWNGLLNSLAIVYTGGGFVSGSGDLVFRVEVNGRPYETLNAVTIQIGSILGNQDIPGIRVYSGQEISLWVTHVANAALGDPTLGRIGGYIYPTMRGN